MQSPVIQQLLLMMENPWVVLTAALCCVALRVLWMLYRRRNPLPMHPASPPRPRDVAFDLLTAVLVVPPIAVLIWFPAPSLWRVIIAAAIYLVLYGVTKLLWTAFRHHRPLPVAVAAPSMVRRKDYTLEVIDTLIIALVLVFGLVRPFLLQTFFIPSGSMIPTLEIDDKLIANKFVLRFRAPHRGEIVVFQPPREAVIGSSPQSNLMLRAFLEDKDNAIQLTSEELNALTVSMVAQSLAYRELQTQGAMQSDGTIRPGSYRTAYDNGLRAAVAQVPRMYSDWLARSGHPAPGDDPRLRSEFLLTMLPQMPAQFDAYIKRVVGVPGDAITIVPGKGVYVNDTLLDEPYLLPGQVREEGAFPAADGEDPGMPQRLATYSAGAEHLGNDTAAWGEFGNEFLLWIREWYHYHYLYAMRIAPHIEAAAFVVPDDAVFVMGDNRSASGSFDSRFWGVVPLENVKARAVSTFWPLERLRLL